MIILRFMNIYGESVVSVRGFLMFKVFELFIFGTFLEIILRFVFNNYFLKRCLFPALVFELILRNCVLTIITYFWNHWTNTGKSSIFSWSWLLLFEKSSQFGRYKNMTLNKNFQHVIWSMLEVLWWFCVKILIVFRQFILSVFTLLLNKTLFIDISL